jgi:hypothetical protein
MTWFGPTIKWQKSRPHRRKKPKITGCAQIQEIERPDGANFLCQPSIWTRQILLEFYPLVQKASQFVPLRTAVYMKAIIVLWKFGQKNVAENGYQKYFKPSGTVS